MEPARYVWTWSRSRSPTPTGFKHASQLAASSQSPEAPSRLRSRTEPSALSSNRSDCRADSATVTGGPPITQPPRRHLEHASANTASGPGDTARRSFRASSGTEQRAARAVASQDPPGRRTSSRVIGLDADTLTRCVGRGVGLAARGRRHSLHRPLGRRCAVGGRVELTKLIDQCMKRLDGRMASRACIRAANPLMGRCRRRRGS
jgi:hypothetical protein